MPAKKEKVFCFCLLKRALENERYYHFSLPVLSPSSNHCPDILRMNQAAKENHPYFLGEGSRLRKLLKVMLEFEPHTEDLSFNKSKGLRSKNPGTWLQGRNCKI